MINCRESRFDAFQTDFDRLSQFDDVGIVRNIFCRPFAE